MFRKKEQKQPGNNIIQALESNKLPFALKLIENTSNIDEILASPEAQPGIEKILGTNLRKFNIENLTLIDEKIKPSPDILKSPQIKAYAVDGVSTALRNINQKDWEKNIDWFLTTFDIEQTDLKSLEIQALVEKRFSDYVKIGSFDKALFLRNKFTPEDSNWKERIKESLCSILKQGNDKKFKELLKIFPQDIDQQVLDSKEVIEHAKLGVEYNLHNKNKDEASSLSDFFGFSLADFSRAKDKAPGGILIKQTRNLSTKLSRKELMLLEKIRKNYPTEA